MRKYDVSKYPVVSAFLQDRHSNVKGIRGPFGSGKSVACCMNILMYAMEQPADINKVRRSRWLVVRNTYRELQDTTIKTWLEWVPENQFGTFKRQALQHEIFFDMPDGTKVELEVLFRSLDSDDDVRKLLSLELTGAWINEAREIDWVIMKNLQGRLGRFPIKNDIPYKNWRVPPSKKWLDSYENGIESEDGFTMEDFGEPYWTGIIMDTNSPDTDHWWYKFAEVETPQGFTFYSQPGGLEPGAENRHNLRKDYYQRMMQGADAEWINVYVNNQYGFLIEGKPVFPEYNDAIHCKEGVQPIPGLKIIRGWDFGLTPACVFFQLDARGRLLILDELVSEDMGIERFADIVFKHSVRRYGHFKFWDLGDPAGRQRAQTDEKSCFMMVDAVMQKYYGDKMDPIEPGRSEIPLRLESIKQHLNRMVDGGPGLLLDKSCRMLRKGFLGMYHYKKYRVSNSDYYKADPEKNAYSHPMDALMHATSVASGLSLLDTDPLFEDEDEYTEPAYRERRGASPICGY